MLTPLALENAALLMRLQAQDFSTKTELAEALGRDLPNLNKTLKRLASEGLVDGATLTAAGANAVRAVQQLQGGAAPPAAVQGGSVAEIPLELIDTDPLLNPRTIFAEEPLQALAESIRDKGVAQPILLRPGLEPGRFRVVAGERRTRAARLAGLTAIPAIIRDLDDDQALEIATIENIQREDLSALEEARAFRKIVDAKMRLHPELSVRDAKEIIAEAVRKTVRYVEQRLDLLELPEKLQDRIALPKDNHQYLSLESARYEVQRIRREKKQAEERLLKPAELLIMAELTDKMDKSPGTMRTWYYGGAKPTEINYDVDGDVVLDGLRKRNLITVTHDHNNDGRSHARYSEYGWTKKDLAAQLPGFASARRAAALSELRARVLGEGEASRCRVNGCYATWWLNGPFKPNPALEQQVKKAEAARKAAETKAEKAAAAAKVTLEAADLLVRELGAREPAALDPQVQGVLCRAERPAPWRMDAKGNIFAANGKVVINDQYYGGSDPNLIAVRLLIVATVNVTAGEAFTIEPQGGALPPDPDSADDDADQAEDA